MQMNNKIDIEAIKSRLEAASEGPWTMCESGGPVLDKNMRKSDGTFFVWTAEDDCIIGPDGTEVLGCSKRLRCDKNDLHFMANARKDIEDLLAEVDRLSSGENEPQD